MGRFDVYTEVSQYIGWINEAIIENGGMSSCGLVIAASPTKGWKKYLRMKALKYLF